MDLRNVLVVSALVLLAQGSTQMKDLNRTSTTLSNSTRTTVSTTPTTPPRTSSLPRLLPPSSATPALGSFHVNWTSVCRGDVLLVSQRLPSTSSHVCFDSDSVETVFRDVCRNKKGCKGEPTWIRGRHMPNGSRIRHGRAEWRKPCLILQVHCADGELQAYKVIVGLLICVLLLVLVCRFTKPTIKALQKRLSDRRQNRWIGPTQSHSVSYHRGKSAIKNNDGDKRSSYPALERLTVSNSREPSSNRNSGYTF